jgi:hypothetical protein
MNAPVKFVGFPDGPKVFVKELDMEVPTFTKEPGGKFPALNYHVPLNKRGPYRLDQLPYKADFTTDTLGYVLCQGYTNAGEKCSKRAQNRSLRCDVHGGRIHPLDKLVKDDQEATNRREGEALSRYRQFQAGQITVEDLDDEELATCGFRASNGRIYKPRNVPRELAQAFTKAIYERAQDGVKANVVEAVEVVAGIMKNPKVEYDIRLKAALSMIDRGLGKAPQQINISAELTGFEQVFDGIFSGRREDSRTGKIVDAEVVDDPGQFAGMPELEQSIGGSAGNSVVTEQDSGSNEPDSRDPRLSARNPAILAQTVEIKPFTYDLEDHSEEIKKDTKRRYAQRAMEADGQRPYIREKLPNGMYRHVLDKDWKPPALQSNSQVQARKRYTLSDFT